MDIDIDIRSDFNPQTIFNSVVRASRVQNDNLIKHPCGVYFQTMPIDPFTNLAAIPYKEAEDLGFVKIDFLHLSILDRFKNKEELRSTLAKEVDWTLFEKEEVVKNLFQIGNYFWLVQKVKPKSIQELADILALMRPGKKDLLDKYLEDKDAIREELYKKTEGGYAFRRSHAVAYSMTIILDLHSNNVLKLQQNE